MNKVLYMLIISILTIGCASQYGTFTEGKYDSSRYLQINQDRTFLTETYRHWWQWNSYGSWTLIPNKKNHILLKIQFELLIVYKKIYHLSHLFQILSLQPA